MDAAIGGDCAGLLLELIYAGADLSTVDSKGYDFFCAMVGGADTELEEVCFILWCGASGILT